MLVLRNIIFLKKNKGHGIKDCYTLKIEIEKHTI
jgi:hypothetical protein